MGKRSKRKKKKKKEKKKKLSNNSSTSNKNNPPDTKGSVSKSKDKEVLTMPNSKEEEKTRIPLIGEKLNVSKKPVTDYIVITKVPVTEKRTIDVEVTEESVVVERKKAEEIANLLGNPTNSSGRPVVGQVNPSQSSSSSFSNSPVERENIVQSGGKILIPIEREEVQVTKEPYIKDEVVVTKEQNTVTKKITQDIRSETVRTNPASPNVTLKEKKNEGEEVGNPPPAPSSSSATGSS